MTAQSFLNTQTIIILVLGLLAFVLDTVAGLLFGKLMAFTTRRQGEPLDRGSRDQRLPHGGSPGSQSGAG